ncbi:MAG TPA: SIMPL domain-containing protein [Streptosporangiaceae bacterium]|nr:SIMPL domain-containing protein [Streptosporangiaceae bacterium]
MAITSPGYRAAAIGVASAALLVGAFSLGASHPAGTPAAAATATTAQVGTQPAGRITVTGTGTVTGTPNQLVVSLGVQVSAGSVSTALDTADQTVSQVTAALRGQGVAPADIQTSGLSIFPNYEPGQQLPVGYQVTESLTATLDQIGAAGRQIQAAVTAGGNAVTVDDVSLNLTDDGPLLAAARTSAVNDARAKAEQFASAAGVPLGPVLSITPVAPSGSSVFAPNAAASSGSAAVPISPGSQQVSVSVTVVYAA